MDQRLEKLEQIQNEMQEQLHLQMQEQLAKIQQDMRDQMLESQENMINQFEQMLAGASNKGKSPMIGTENNDEDPSVPPGFTPAGIQTPQPRVSINIKSPCQTGTSVPMNFPIGSISNPKDNLANPRVPDFDEAVEVEKARMEIPKQLEDHCKWLEDKFKALENVNYHGGIDAKDLSLVSDLVLPPKFKMPEFEKYNGTSCPEVQKIEAGESTKKSVPRKRENEVNNVSRSCAKPITVNQPRIVNASQQASSKQESDTKRNTEKLQFTSILVTYKELYQTLFNAHVVSPVYLKLMQPPYPKWYNENVQCEYHAGITGHAIENCTAFKMLVEKLLEMGIIKFDESFGGQNPLPNHADKGVNAVIENAGKRARMTMVEVRTSLREVWKEIMKRGLITQSLGNRPQKIGNYCEFHDEEDHEIQECDEFRALIQELMDNKELEFFEYVEERDVCTSEGGLLGKDCEINRPRVIISQPKIKAPRIVIQKPAAFPYKDSKRVPWSYNCNVTIPEGKNQVNTQGEAQDQGEELLVQEPIAENEAKEFLKFLKHSEYSVVEQLNKQPARISVLTLLLSSEIHHNALMKVLNETYVANDITVNNLDRLINNISADNFISFSDDEIPSGGRGSTKALHITTRCKGYTVPGVLIDNGSALNVLPLSTLNRLPIDNSHMKTCQNMVRAFDGTERKVMGRIEVPLLIGPNIYEVDFLVMDIKPSYNCLLGRPWIYATGALPSLLHQKLKLIMEGRLITINAEEDIIASVTSDAPYIEKDDEALECSFRLLEFVNATFIIEGSKILIPKVSSATKMGLQLMVGSGALPGRGLGKYLHGRVEPDAKQKKKEAEKRQERQRARLSGAEIKWEPMSFPHISETFVSGGIIYLESGMTREECFEDMFDSLSINAILGEEVEEGNLLGIRPYVPGSVLNNWTAEEIPVIFRANSKSLDINDTSSTDIDPESLLEQGLCLEGSQDFEDDEDYSLSLDLLRMVEREKKQILPYQETIRSVALEEGKKVKIGTCIKKKTRQDLIELLREFKDVFA
ncbi:uncharacterized protein LOC108459067 [Gossypium arboreum]|uniref:uncharacterized protein LOC108459067 n=1 Tax=Gossypium arboreum TaxID=29729 RepID=UPI0022F19698|nr:uncharacterized protein LOC108459067 [Gossypium arboreum]